MVNVNDKYFLQVLCSFCIRELLVIYEPTMNNGLRLLCYQIAICCLHTSVLWGIQRLPPTLIMNLEFVLGGSLTMPLKGQENPEGFGKNLHGDQSLLLSGSLAALEQMGVGGTMSPLRFRIQSGCCCSVHTGR